LTEHGSADVTVKLSDFLGKEEDSFCRVWIGISPRHGGNAAVVFFRGTSWDVVAAREVIVGEIFKIEEVVVAVFAANFAWCLI